MNGKLQRFLWSSAVTCLVASGCSTSRTCCKPCMEGEGVPLENVVSVGPAEGDSSGTIVDNQIIQVPTAPASPTGPAPSAPSWQPAPQGQSQQVPPTVHPTPPPRQSTSSKPAETGATPDVIRQVPKELPAEAKKIVPEKLEPVPPKKSDSIPPVRKPGDDTTSQQTPKTVPSTIEVPKPPLRNADLRPASLRVKVSTSMVVTNVGDKVTFDLVVENQGGMSISNVDLQAILNDNLKPIDTEPMNAGRIDRNTITFASIKNLGNTPQRFKVRAEVVKADGGVGLITAEALSPILTAGPLRDQATVRILPKD